MIKPPRLQMKGQRGAQFPSALSGHGKPSQSPVGTETPFNGCTLADCGAEITARLISTAAGVQYGGVSVTFKIHGGRVCDVGYNVTHSMREKGVRV